MSSHQRINLSPDLKKLRDAGYDIEVVAGFLIMRDVPYVTAQKEIKLGILASNLTVVNDRAEPPDNHQAYFCGEMPCNIDGTPIVQIGSSPGTYPILPDLVAQFYFSNKAQNEDGSHKPDSDYFEKMSRYVEIISGPASSIDKGATAKTFRVAPDTSETSVFRYMDTASSRAGIVAVSKKLEMRRVAIIGLGGTGSYVCDLVAKTPVQELNLIDGDKFLQHNAFRSPGAPSPDELDLHLSKAAYFRDLYSKMRTGIVAHEQYITSENVDMLQGMDFVFICIDRCEPKKIIIDKLVELGIPFIDVGMGVQLVDDSLLGQLRVTLSTPEKRDHISRQICLVDANEDPDYDQNIQIADLNALNATLAVIKWKKFCGFYLDLDGEHNSTYIVDGNKISNEDKP